MPRYVLIYVGFPVCTLHVTLFYGLVPVALRSGCYTRVRSTGLPYPLHTLHTVDTVAPFSPFVAITPTRPFNVTITDHLLPQRYPHLLLPFIYGYALLFTFAVVIDLPHTFPGSFPFSWLHTTFLPVTALPFVYWLTLPLLPHWIRLWFDFLVFAFTVYGTVAFVAGWLLVTLPVTLRCYRARTLFVLRLH